MSKMYPHRLELSPDNIRVGTLYRNRRRRGSYKVLGISRDESGVFSVVLVKQVAYTNEKTKCLDHVDDLYWTVITVKDFCKMYRLSTL